MVTEPSNRPDADLPRIVYVAGYGRSGSTLLDVILGSHEQIVGTGEFTHLFQEIENDAKCSCLEPVAKCEFWSDVLQRVGSVDGVPDTAAGRRALTRATERMFPGHNEARDAAYAELWKRLFQAVGAAAGVPFVADSSKNTRITWRRAELLVGAGFDLRAIHLVRDPRAVMFSVRKGFNDRIEEGKQGGVLGGYFRGLYGWTLSNIAAKAMQRKIGAERVMLLRYEDLVARPYEEIARIGQFLRIDTTNLESGIRAEQPLDPGHGVSGNRMRRQGPLKFRIDEEWKTALPGYAKWAALIIWPMARAFGYSWKLTSNPRAEG